MPTDQGLRDHSRWSPEPDYPAAHSMDTTFYAVDAHGNVAAFFSGETGPVPNEGSDLEFARFLRLLRGEPEPDDDDGDIDWDAAEDEALDRGFFLYEYIDSDVGFVHPYTRIGEPGPPVHLDQLPPAARAEVARARMPDADFAAAEKLQLVDQVACFFYSDEDVGYLTPGEKEVRPIPGREEKYLAALPAFKKQYPKLKFADAPPPEGKK
ncbi:MAG: hypothetical protein J2P46_08325 [Zavarzinella sp.]|nr:hypothetical protein [Zavarzinella sp.]